MIFTVVESITSGRSWGTLQAVTKIFLPIKTAEIKVKNRCKGAKES